MLLVFKVRGLTSMYGCTVVNDAELFPHLIDYGEFTLKLSQFCLKPRSTIEQYLHTSSDYCHNDDGLLGFPALTYKIPL